MAHKPLYRCFTKALRDESGIPTRSERWVVSRRAWFRVYPDRVQCGDWVIPFNDVTGGVVYKARQGFIRSTVLELSTSETTYQFGFNPWADPVSRIPITFPVQNVRVRWSVFSVFIRVVLIAYLLYWVVQRYRGS